MKMMHKVFLTIGLIMMLSANVKMAGSERVITQSVILSGYQKIENTQVPVEVLKSVSSKYKGYVLSESYLSGNGMFKLTLIKKRKTVYAYFKSTGEFIK